MAPRQKRCRRRISPQTRMDQGRQFKALYASLGFNASEVAQLLHVSTRSVHNWVSGSVPVPFMAVKLLRLLLRYELPGKAWEGWHLSAGRLYTPEGFELAPHEVSWWSLLVRQARGFRALYLGRSAAGADRRTEGDPACGGGLRAPKASGLVTSINNGEVGVSAPGLSQVNQGLTRGDITAPQWHQPDHKLTSCPTPCDSLPSLTQKPEHGPSASASASMPSSRLPLTRISVGNLLALNPNPPARPSHSSPRPPRSAHQHPRSKALHRIGASSTPTPTCGPTWTPSSQTALKRSTKTTRPQRLPLSLSTGQPASAQRPDSPTEASTNKTEGGAA